MKMKKLNDTYTSKHAWSCTTDLKMILANLSSIEHSIETGNFINLHWNHIQDLGNLVHCSKSEEVSVLLLSDHENWDDC
jgi:hypothetical protein